MPLCASNATVLGDSGRNSESARSTATSHREGAQLHAGAWPNAAAASCSGLLRGRSSMGTGVAAYRTRSNETVGKPPVANLPFALHH